MQDGSELIPYNIPQYRAFFSSSANNDQVIDHWHDDMEFIYVESGTLAYSVNGQEMLLGAGEGIYTNSRRIHGHRAASQEPVVYSCVLLHPDLLSANAEIRRQYIDPLLHNSSLPYVLLSQGDEQMQPLLSAMACIVQSAAHQKPTLGLTLLQCGFQMLECLYRYMIAAPRQAVYIDPRMEALHGMIGYVQSHYSGEVSLADIAAAGRVSKSGCCAIFREYLHQTPVGYLTSYRLERGAKLLRNTNLTITEIAMRSGFASQSYFTETFRKHNGLTPSEYRRQQALKERTDCRWQADPSK